MLEWTLSLAGLGSRAKVLAASSSLAQRDYPWRLAVDLIREYRAGIELGAGPHGKAGNDSVLRNLPDTGKCRLPVALSRRGGPREGTGTRKRGYLAGSVPAISVAAPLSLFQWVLASKEGTWKLVREINRGLERPNDEKLLEAGFGGRWPSLKRRLERILIETTANGVEREIEAMKPVYRLTAEAEALWGKLPPTRMAR